MRVGVLVGGRERLAWHGVKPEAYSEEVTLKNLGSLGTRLINYFPHPWLFAINNPPPCPGLTYQRVGMSLEES